MLWSKSRWQIQSSWSNRSERRQLSIYVIVGIILTTHRYNLRVVVSNITTIHMISTSTSSSPSFSSTTSSTSSITISSSSTTNFLSSCTTSGPNIGIVIRRLRAMVFPLKPALCIIDQYGRFFNVGVVKGSIKERHEGLLL